MSCFDEEPDGNIHGECAHEIKMLQERVDRLLKQTTLDSHRIAAWKECAEHQYGLLRLQRGFDDTDYPIEGALDSWANGRHPCLKQPDDTDYTPNAYKG